MNDKQQKILKLYIDMLGDVIETAIMAIECVNESDTLCIAGALKSTREPIEKIKGLINAKD